MKLIPRRVLLTLAVIGLVLCGLGLASVAFATDYYVATNGNDSWPGTIGQPWLTITKAGNTMVAGDTTYVRGGTYNGSTNWFWPANSGTASNPITLKAYPGETPTLTGAGHYDAFIYLGYSGNQYFVVDGLYSNNTTGDFIVLLGNATHCVLKNCHFTNHQSTMVQLQQGGYHTIENNYFDTTGDPSGEGDGDHIYLLGSDRNLIQNNYFTKAGHAAVDFIDYNNLAEVSEYNILRNNTIEQHWGSGTGLIRHSTHIVVESNKVYYVGEGVTTYPKSGIMIVAEDNIVRNNLVAWTSAGPQVDNAMTFEGYTFGGIGQNSRYNCVYNNVIYKAGREGLYVTQRDSCSVTQNHFLNNILYYNQVAGGVHECCPTGNYVAVFDTYHANANNKWPYFANDNYFHHNLMLHADASGDHPGEDPFIYYGQDSWGHSLAWVQSSFPNAFWSNIEQNPKFVNADAGDFHLQSDSPAINTGAFLTKTSSSGSNTTTVPVVEASYFHDGFGIVTGDQVKVGSNSPVTITAVNYSTNTLTVASPISFAANDPVSLPYQGSAPDMGAYEYSGTPQPPVANFTGNPTSGYTPLNVAFTDTSTNSPTAWSWTFGDSGTSTAQHPSHQYTSAGSYTVSLTATNSAGSDGETKTNYITASTPPAPPVANFTGSPTSGTAPLTVNFTDTSTNTPTAWSWAFGDSGTSTVQNPSHQYTGAGNYTVTLTATNAGGSDGETKTNYISVQASGAPTFVAAGAVASGTGAITPALPAGLATNDILLLLLETANEAISVANQNGGTWSEVTNSPQGTGSGAGSGATRLTAFWSRYNGTQGAPTTSDSGNHQLGRVIAVRGAATSGNPWDVTAGGVESTVDTSGAIPGATTTVANTLVVAAIAAALPDADGTANFSTWANSNLTGVAERTDNTVTAGNGGGLGTATGEKATAGAYGNTTVTCATAAKKGMISIALKPAGGGGSPPVANFAGSPTSGAVPLAVNFTDTSTNSPTSWSWTFGDSGTSTAQNPSHQYTSTGSFTVSLTATNAYGSDGETKTNYITVTVAPPVANFTGAPTSGAAPLPVSFTDTSTGSPTAWSWSFGDSSTSTVQNPSHTYAAGTYTVSLTATNAGGSDGETKTNYITAGSGPTEVYVYPDQYELQGGATLISGGLADLQTSNDVYMRMRCNTSTHDGGVKYWWHTSYTPSQVSKITVEYEFHTTYATTPEFELLIYNQSGSFDGMYGGLWTTTDQWFTWYSTNVSAYLSGSGVICTTACGCHQNSNNWDEYMDVVRVKLTLN